MKGSKKNSSGIEETNNQEESKDKEGLTSSNQDKPGSALQNLVETGENGGPIKTVTGYATLKDLGMLAKVNKKFQSAMNKEIEQRLPMIRSISIGREHTMLLVKITLGENKLYACGRNDKGQLALGDYEDRNEWTEVPPPDGVKVEKIITGNYHSVLIGKDMNGQNKLYACGENLDGQLGLGDSNRLRHDHRNEWTEVTLLPQGFRLENIICGDKYTFFKGTINGEDKFYRVGEDGFSNLGRYQMCELLPPEALKKVDIIQNAASMVYVNGRVKEEDKWYFRRYTQPIEGWKELIPPEDFKIEELIAVRSYQFLKGKDKNGENQLYARGWNKYGQLGLGDNENRRDWTKVTLPEGFTIEKVITGTPFTFLQGKGSDGQSILYACGVKQFGSRQLCLNDPEIRFRFPYINKWTKVPVPKDFTIEEVILTKLEEYAELVGYHIFLKGNGKDGQDKLYGFGNNEYGQLGLNDTEERNEWTEVPLRNRVLKSIVSKEEASMNKKRSGGK